MLTFRRALPADAELLRSLAERIWWACYPGIISHEQIDYMLGWMYALEKIREEIAEGIVWELAELAAVPIGFLAVEMAADGTAKLHKLYLLPELHGHGHGQAMIARAGEIARSRGARELWLQVNKQNVRALGAYERAGFRRVKEAVADIGAGFVMDDYILSWSLPETA